ncbi:type IV pilus modification PilV family protein [Rubripirellula amarantea]|nr:hypothetical protein [Rubripirellula amarantea]
MNPLQDHSDNETFDCWCVGSRRCHSGVTLMECIFAIGVILTGLVGVAALIPIAARNAQATLELDQSINESTSAAASGEAKLINDLGRMVFFNKEAAGLGAYAPNYGPSGQIETLLERVITTGLSSPGYSFDGQADLLTGSICIDPLGMPELSYLDGNFVTGTPNASNPFLAVDVDDTAYDYSRFPYYGERYSVIAPPNESISAAGATPAPVGPPTDADRIMVPWPMTPRMHRTTLLARDIGAAAPIGRDELMSATVARSIFSGSGGLSGIAGSEDDSPASVLYRSTRFGGAPNDYRDSGRTFGSKYTWFATLVPSRNSANRFRQSIVVVRDRVSSVPRRNGDPLALQKTPYTIDEADDNPTGERVAWVYNTANAPITGTINPIGFDGGVGGEITLVGSQAVSDEVVVGEWVMLSRQPHRQLSPVFAVDPPFVPDGPAVHRWYRVIRADDPIELTNFAIPDTSTTRDVWARTIALAGPDWEFSPAWEVVPNTTAINDTVCTIVSGAVSVIESTVVIE